MKIIAFLLLVCSGFTALAQAPAKYDSLLASQLHADEHGMKTYVLAILKTGPKDKVITDKKERATLFQGHMANIQSLADKRMLSVAGPFEKNNSNMRGIFILNVPTIEEARKLVETDPAVKAGIFVTELYIWYGSAILQAVPEMHKSIEHG